ncbi:unnamed protein product [Cunninghamella echinulata]
MSQAVGNTALAYARVWHVVDARQRILGRLATNVATTLMGKHKPIYDPAADCGDYVVVINAKDILVSGKKAEQKLYRHHTGHPGGLKEMNFENLMKKILPRLRDDRLNRLLIFEGSEHPYEANIIKQHGIQNK